MWELQGKRKFHPKLQPNGAPEPWHSNAMVQHHYQRIIFLAWLWKCERWLLTCWWPRVCLNASHCFICLYVTSACAGYCDLCQACSCNQAHLSERLMLLGASQTLSSFLMYSLRPPPPLTTACQTLFAPGSRHVRTQRWCNSEDNGRTQRLPRSVMMWEPY